MTNPFQKAQLGCHTNGALRSRLKPFLTRVPRYGNPVESHQWGSAEPTETTVSLFPKQPTASSHTNGALRSRLKQCLRTFTPRLLERHTNGALRSRLKRPCRRGAVRPSGCHTNGALRSRLKPGPGSSGFCACFFCHTNGALRSRLKPFEGSFAQQLGSSHTNGALRSRLKH